MEQWIKNGLLLLLLGVGSVFDVKSKKLPGIVLAAGAIIGILCSDLWPYKNVGLVFLSLLPGIGLIVLARLTHENIGYGDGIVVLLLGIWKGFLNSLSVLVAALFLLSLWGILLLLSGKGHRKTRIPFVPFLLAAQGWMLQWHP